MKEVTLSFYKVMSVPQLLYGERNMDNESPSKVVDHEVVGSK